MKLKCYFSSVLGKQAIEEFKKFYKKELGLEISNEKAIELGASLIRLVKVVYGSDLPKKWVSGTKKVKNKG